MTGEAPAGVPWVPVLRMCEAAGAEILAHYHAGVAVDTKGDGSPLTAADRAAHEVLIAGLARLDPGTPVVSEEGDVPAYAVRQAWRRFWLVDPLDGTKEFLQRNGEFTVNVALVEDGVPVLGVVHAPALGVSYAAARGHGAWRYRAGEAPARCLAREAPGPDGLVIVESRSHPSARLEAWLATVPVAGRVQVGSSLKFCLVADGTADCYPRFGPTMEWDVAAGDCVWRNAVLQGQRPSPLRYNSPELRNGDFVIGYQPQRGEVGNVP